MSSGNTTQGAALTKANQSIENFAASLSTAAVIFGVQIAIFLILSGNWKLHKRAKKNVGEGETTDKAVERQSLFHKI
jgi:uncharacterized membrane protein